MKVSIITVCLNAQGTIEETVKSVISQTHKNIDYIVIDGQSTDNTINILRKNISKISTFISEKDKGIYDAMNKGIAHAKGDIIYFLNSGDILYDKTTISRIAQIFSNRNVDIVYGDIILKNPNNLNEKTLQCHRYADNAYLTCANICHQSIFTRKQVFTRYGGFNTKYSIASDFDWLLRSLLQNKIAYSYTNQIIANYLLGGVSMSDDNKYLMKERNIILSLHFNYLQIILNRLIMKFRSPEIYYQKLLSTSSHK